MSSLTVTDLGGGYGRLPVFRDVSLELKKGATLGIIGPNGAGKSTLLKTLAGLLPAFGGDVLLGDQNLVRLAAHRRCRKGLVLVPEGRQILVNLSVSENLELPEAAGRLPRHAYQTRLEEVLDIFPRLRERLKQSGGTLSGGEQQMLAIARAMLLDPVVLMLDEPTQGLAPVMVVQVRDALLKLKGRFPMLIVEQNRAFLGEVADETIWMRGGEIFEKEGTSDV